MLFRVRIFYVSDLLFNLNNTESFDVIAQGPRSEFLSGGGAKLDEIFLFRGGGGMLGNCYLISLK